MTMQCCLNIAETDNQSQAKCNLFISAVKELAAFFTAIDSAPSRLADQRSIGSKNWIRSIGKVRTLCRIGVKRRWQRALC
jgi:hypothetical protein